MDAMTEEMNTNYLSYLHLVKAFVPYLQKSDKETSFIFTTSGLALVGDNKERGERRNGRACTDLG